MDFELEPPSPDDVARAERWVTRVGIHFDREDELDEFLFTRRGPLHAHAADLALRARMRALWRGHRREGERLEQDELDRAQAWKDARARAKELRVD